MTPVSRFELVLILMAAIVVAARAAGAPPADATGGSVHSRRDRACATHSGHAGRRDGSGPGAGAVPAAAACWGGKGLSHGLARLAPTCGSSLRSPSALSLLTTAAVGIVAHWMKLDLPWAACSPRLWRHCVATSDAVAAKAILQRVALPPRVTLLLEGESLVNDATGPGPLPVRSSRRADWHVQRGHAVS